MDTRKAILIILDGWGLGEVPADDAIAQARTPTFDHLWKAYPHNTLTTFGEEVGLPVGQVGNSEVGHLNIGAGHVVMQMFARINKAVREDELAKIPKLQKAFEYARTNNKAVHFMGLVSDGGVHSHIDHLLYLIEAADRAGVASSYVHAFTDGRDVDPKSGAGFIEQVLESTKDHPTKLASIVGRYYAMDRDQRWERIHLAYELLVHGKGEATTDPAATMRARYETDETDEFLKPIVVVDEAKQPVGTIQPGDVVISFNFRTDRPRQITRALTQEDFPNHGMKRLNVHYVTMARYDETFEGIEVLFEKENLRNTLGEWLSNLSKTQLRIAETEKYPHVTFFFSGGQEEPFPGEERIVVPSPQEVATYDQKPEMSAQGITDEACTYIAEKQPDFICLNYANADMVGHTGVFDAAVRAAEFVDQCLKKLLDTALAHQYEAIIIADHGNSDIMRNPDGSPHTAHTGNLVPCIFVSPDRSEAFQMRAGKLGDIAPTLLYLMGIEPPSEMDGEVLLQKI